MLVYFCASEVGTSKHVMQLLKDSELVLSHYQVGRGIAMSNPKSFAWGNVSHLDKGFMQDEALGIMVQTI